MSPLILECSFDENIFCSMVETEGHYLERSKCQLCLELGIATDPSSTLFPWATMLQKTMWAATG